MSRPREAPLSLDPDFVRGVAEVFGRIPFTEEVIRDYLAGRVELVPVSAENLPRFIRAANGGAPIDTLLQLFAFGADVGTYAVAEAVAPMTIQEWLDGGLLTAPSPGRLRAAFRVSPQQGVLVAFDRVDAGIERAADYVMGVAATTADLMDARLPGPFGRVLDLGTACGATAIARASSAEFTVATDILERAANLSRFNAMLNNVTAIDVRVGDLLAPVEGERFDFVTMNAPHVITPDGGVAYRDGGHAGEGFVRRLASELPTALELGGFCQFTAQWLDFEGEPWQDRLKGWFEGSGCDVWIIRTRTQSPESHAEKFIRELEVHTAESYTRRFEAWLSWFEAQGASGVCAGIITLRRRDGHNWFHSSDARSVDPGAGAAIRRGFDVRDFLAASSADDLLRTAFLASPDVELHTTGRTTGDGWATRQLELELTTGLRSTVNVDPATVQILGHSNGKRSLAALVKSLADSAQAPYEVVARAVLGATCHLLERDMLHLPSLGLDSGFRPATPG